MNSAGSILFLALLAASPPGTLDPDDVPHAAPGRPYVEALFAGAGEPKPSDEDCIVVELDMAITNPAFPEVVRLASSPAFRERFARVFEKSLGRKPSTASIIRWAIRYDAGADDAWLAADLARRERSAKIPAVVRGRVIDSVAREPIPEADVSAFPRRTRTDPAGRFKISCSPHVGGQIHVRVSAEGFGDSLVVRKQEEGEMDFGDFVLGPGSTVEGRAVDEKGEPVELAGVSFMATVSSPTGYFACNYFANTDHAGRFRIARLPASVAGSSLSVTSSRHARQYVSWRPGQGALADIKLSTAPILAGTVVDSRGRPIPFAGIEVMDARGRLHQRAGNTGADGRFRVACQMPGKLRLVATSAGLLSGVAEAEADPAKPVESIRIECGEGEFLVGRAVKADGQPLAGATVSNATRTDAPSSEPRLYYRCSTATDADGAFRLGPVPSEGTYRFYVSDPDARSSVVGNGRVGDDIRIQAK